MSADIAEHIVVPETQNTIARCFNLPRSSGVGFLLFVVLPAVQFDDEPGFTAHKIDNERADQCLSPKMRSCQRDVMAQSSPQNTLCVRRLCPHPASELFLAIVHFPLYGPQFFSCRPPPLTPPRKGEGRKSGTGERALSPTSVTK